MRLLLYFSLTLALFACSSDSETDWSELENITYKVENYSGGFVNPIGISEYAIFGKSPTPYLDIILSHQPKYMPTPKYEIAQTMDFGPKDLDPFSKIKKINANTFRVSLENPNAQYLLDELLITTPNEDVTVMLRVSYFPNR